MADAPRVVHGPHGGVSGAMTAVGREWTVNEVFKLPATRSLLVGWQRAMAAGDFLDLKQDALVAYDVSLTRQGGQEERCHE